MTSATIDFDEFDEFDYDFQEIDPEAVDLLMSMNDALASAEGEDGE